MQTKFATLHRHRSIYFAVVTGLLFLVLTWASQNYIAKVRLQFNQTVDVCRIRD